MKCAWVICVLTGVGYGGVGRAADDLPLRLVQTIEMTGVEGRFDHFAADVRGRRLFVAALGNNTLEVIDLAEGKRLQTIGGLRRPAGVAYRPASGEIVVTSNQDGRCCFYDGRTYALLREVRGMRDADNVRYDPGPLRVYVGYGGGAMGAIDSEKGKKVSDFTLDGHPESFQLEQNGTRMYINVPDARHVAALDRVSGQILARWKLPAAENYPMALDEGNHRLFVACRKPAKLVVLDTEGGRVVDSVDCVADADDVWYDEVQKRIYVSGGEGLISVILQADADHYGAVGQVPTAPGARTSFFIPEMRMLYVAVPHRDVQKAEIRGYRTAGGE